MPSRTQSPSKLPFIPNPLHFSSSAGFSDIDSAAWSIYNSVGYPSPPLSPTTPPEPSATFRNRSISRECLCLGILPPSDFPRALSRNHNQRMTTLPQTPRFSRFSLTSECVVLPVPLHSNEGKSRLPPTSQILHPNPSHAWEVPERSPASGAAEIRDPSLELATRRVEKQALAAPCELIGEVDKSNVLEIGKEGRVMGNV